MSESWFSFFIICEFPMFLWKNSKGVSRCLSRYFEFRALFATKGSIGQRILYFNTLFWDNRSVHVFLKVFLRKWTQLGFELGSPIPLPLKWLLAYNIHRNYNFGEPRKAKWVKILLDCPTQKTLRKFSHIGCFILKSNLVSLSTRLLSSKFCSHCMPR